MLVVKYPEPWARSHQQRWHSEALQMYGERVLIRHRWNIADYALGRVKRCSACSAGVRLNEQQRVRTIGATGGTFTLTFAGQTTGAIDWDATRTEVQDALLALEVNGPGDIVVSGDAIASPGLTVEFLGQWAAVETIPTMTYSTSNLSPAGASLELLQLRPGTGGTNIHDRVTAVYKQSGDSWCVSCYGIGFEGGFEPIVYVSFALITDQQAETTHTQGGVIQKEDPKVQFSFEPLVQEFDLMARVLEWEDDLVTPRRVAGRFLLNEMMPTTIRTGPGSPDDSITVIPERWKTVYNIQNPDWVIGQEGSLEILPWEHAWNLVPLTRQEERLVSEGVLQNRKWYEQAGVSVPLDPRETHP